jgi:hypothetical protein
VQLAGLSSDRPAFVPANRIRSRCGWESVPAWDLRARRSILRRVFDKLRATVTLDMTVRLAARAPGAAGCAPTALHRHCRGRFAATIRAMQNRALLTEPELAARLDEFWKSVEEFNDGYYFESHETLEDLWMVTALPERDFFQGVIQLSAAFVHFFRGEYPGILKLMDAAIEKLRRFTPEQFGVDVSALVADAERVRAEFVALGAERFGEWDPRGAPKIAGAQPVRRARRRKKPK